MEAPVQLGDAGRAEATAPLVSTIIIFLNGERFLDEAVASVFAQSYPHWELLLCDDGSTDGSSAIARGYAERHPDRVRYLEHPGHRNRGMSATRNLGAAHARGELIAFLDADDVWLPRKLEQQVALLAAHPEAGMVYGRTLIWYGWTGAPDDAALDHTLSLGIAPDTLAAPPWLFLMLLENKHQSPTTCNALIRRRAFDAAGGFQEAFRGMFEDQAFFLKLGLATPVFVADTLWARYRQHPESCCAVAERAGTAERARLPLLRWMSGYLRDAGVSDPRVWSALRRELWACEHPLLHAWRGRAAGLLGAAAYRLRAAGGRS